MARQQKVATDWMTLSDVAEYLGWTYDATRTANQRGKADPTSHLGLPAPDWTVGRSPVWLRDTISRWARDTGRMSDDGTPKFLRAPRGAQVRRVAA